ncbi:TetR/AcrR family transcriptional regulator [Micromonospora sp. CPCC 205561]|uniref:TetR/AcrR family transcriptional regulator n=1 Tax=Micromonospora sp. CPCC 205561 TaxID=3122407 RepID=UPI003FA56194
MDDGDLDAEPGRLGGQRLAHALQRELARAVEPRAYAKLSIEGIAAAAGVGKQTIYRWWPSKGALLFDAFLALTTDGGQDGRSGALPDTGDLAADLKLVLRAIVDELNDPRYDLPMRALHTEIVHDPALAADYATRLDGPVRELKKERLRAARRAGQLAEDVDLDVAVDLLFGPVLNRWLQRTGPLTHDYADQVVDTALRGLRPREP